MTDDWLKQMLDKWPCEMWWNVSCIVQTKLSVGVWFQLRLCRKSMCQALRKRTSREPLLGFVKYRCAMVQTTFSTGVSTFCWQWTMQHVWPGWRKYRHYRVALETQNCLSVSTDHVIIHSILPVRSHHALHILAHPCAICFSTYPVRCIDVSSV